VTDRPRRKDPAVDQLVREYRKLPVVIEATDPITDDNAEKIAAWCGGRVIREAKPSDPSDVFVAVQVPTLEGVMTGPVGWRVLRGVKGEFYPCDGPVFDATYVEVAPAGRGLDRG